jgi:hypothetical protein
MQRQESRARSEPEARLRTHDTSGADAHMHQAKKHKSLKLRVS